MEGYLTHGNITLFLLQQRALVVAFLRLHNLTKQPSSYASGGCHRF